MNPAINDIELAHSAGQKIGAGQEPRAAAADLGITMDKLIQCRIDQFAEYDKGLREGRVETWVNQTLPAS
jgi:hypothetical protein